MIPIVVGRLAAHTPSLLIVPSVFSVSARGDAQAKQPIYPGTISWICEDSASSETPDSNQTWPILLHIVLIVILAA